MTGLTPEYPDLDQLHQVQDAPLIADAAGCSEQEYQRLVSVRQQAEMEFLGAYDAALAADLEAQA